jgi:hypothetical protein
LRTKTLLIYGGGDMEDDMLRGQREGKRGKGREERERERREERGRGKP